MVSQLLSPESPHNLHLNTASLYYHSSLIMPPRRPRPKLSLWTRFRLWLRYWESPLQLRSSLIRLNHHKHPLLTLLLMFIPYPSWFFPIPGPYSLRALIGTRKIIRGLFGHTLAIYTISGLFQSGACATHHYGLFTGSTNFTLPIDTI